jgi:hypothetical protein
MTHWYHRKIPKLKFDYSIFDDIVSYAESAIWNEGYDQNGLKWNVRELPLSFEDFPILNELYEGLNAEFKRKHAYISWVQPGGLVNHIDHRKWGNMGIPLKGDFSTTPQYFFDQFNHPVEKFVLDAPVIFNTRMLHAVPIPEDDLEPRWILMMGIHDWVDKLFDKIDNDEIWSDTEHFVYG